MLPFKSYKKLLTSYNIIALYGVVFSFQNKFIQTFFYKKKVRSVCLKNLKVYLVIIYCMMFVFITNYMPSKLSFINEYNFLFMSYKIFQLHKMRTIFRNKIILFKNLYYLFKSKLKNPIILIKSNKISVMQITILMIFGLSVSYTKNMRVPGHKKILYSSTFNRSVTYLQFPCKQYQSSQRNIMRIVNAATKQSADHSVFISKRSYAAAHGGTLKIPQNPTIPKIKTGQPTASSDSTEPISSDTTGKHKVGVLSVCNKRECKTTNCAEGTEETNPCKVSGEMHQQPIAENILPKNIVHELNGAITHKIPKGSEGSYLSPDDFNGKPEPQYIMKEKGVVPINPQDFKESEKLTLYLQGDSITKRMADNAANDSVLNLYNKEISIHTSQVNTPLDDKF